MNLLKIRSAVSGDLTDVKSCAKEAYQKYAVRMGQEPAPMNADFARQIADGQVDVVMNESMFIGYVAFYPEGDSVYLESLAVLPEWSGRGIGKYLITHVENFAQRAGYQTVELYTNELMTENLAMYLKLGYTEVDRRCNEGFKRVFFRKQL